MAKVAFDFALQDEHLVPWEFTNFIRRAPNPAGIVALVPTMPDVKYSPVALSQSLRLPYQLLQSAGVLGISVILA